YDHDQEGGCIGGGCWHCTIAGGCCLEHPTGSGWEWENINIKKENKQCLY
ncbi:2543_t:CDS:2, partial [Scutellospora calospora]